MLTQEQKQTLLDRGLSQFQIDNLERTQGRTSFSPQMEQRGIGGAITGVGKGALKGVGSTLFGLGTLAEKGISAISGKRREEIGIVPEEKPQALIPQTTAEKVGYGAETIAEFLLPSTAILKATKGIGLAGRAVVEAGVGGGITAVKEGGITDAVKTNAIISAAFPVLGTALKVAKGVTGKTLTAAGEKIQFSKIRPTAADVSDGFKIENVKKYDLGGSLMDTFSKTQDKLNKLSQQLKRELKGAQEFWSEQDRTPINLNSIFQGMIEKFQKIKPKQFGDIGAIQDRAFSHLKNEIDLVTGGSGNVDIITAQMVKQGAGKKGAWAFGRADPDAGAIEQAYSAFYRELKQELENFGSPAIRKINKQISELIPINNAIIRRIPVEQRNNAISLTDSIALYSAVFDPRALALLGAQKLSKSGRFANVLIKAGEELKQKPKTAVGQRFIRGFGVEKGRPKGL